MFLYIYVFLYGFLNMFLRCCSSCSNFSEWMRIYISAMQASEDLAVPYGQGECTG